MNKSKFVIPLMTLFLMFGYLLQIPAQTDKELLAQLVAEDQDAINALVLYPEDTRLAILEASLYPEALIKLESIQSQTSTSFRELMDRYPRNAQEMVWDLTRYPNLVHRLAMSEPGSKADIKKILEDYPDVIHRRAEEAALVYHPLLMEIDQLNMAADSAFNSLLVDYPGKSQAALRELITLPEVLTILTDNIRLTVLAGDIYRKDPEWVLHKTDSFHLEVARRNAEEIEDWKAGLENDPQALEELKASAESYEEEYGYDDDYYDYSDDDLYYDSEVENVVVRHYYEYNYPYWFGYPSWYYYPRWRIYPVWYDWGFYIGNRGTCMVMNLPSFYFMNWYFYYPHHHHNWPYLSAHFTKHHYGHRAIGVSSISTTVTDWRGRNRDVVSDDWMRDDGRLTERFKEYGKFESAREKYNREHPQKAQTQKEYLDRNTRRYPKISEEAKKIERDRQTFKEPVRPDIKRKETTAPRKQNEPVTRKQETTVPRKKNEPTIKKQETTVPRKQNEPIIKKQETTVPRKQNEPIIRKQLPPVRTTPKINKGKDYHQNTWEKAKVTRPKTTTRPAPKINTKPKTVKPKAPKTTVPKTRKKN